MSPVLCEVIISKVLLLCSTWIHFLLFAVCFWLFATNLEVDSKEQDLWGTLGCAVTKQQIHLTCIWRKWFCFVFFMVTPLQPLLILSRTDCVLTSGPFKSTSQLSDIQKQDFEEKPRNNTPAPNLPSHRSAHVSDGSGCKLAHRSEAASLMLHSLRSHPSSALLFSQSSFTLLFTVMSLSFMGFFLFSPNLYSPNCRSGFVDVRWKLTTRSVFNYITEGESWHSSVQLEKKNL